MESPPPRFSEQGSPKFTEHFNVSPPYQQYNQQYQNFDGHDTGIPQYAPEAPGIPIQHRLSNKERQLSPSELISPMPESYRTGEDEKEVYVPPVQPDPYQRPLGEHQRRERICNLSAIWLWVLFGMIVALAIGLGVGLGVGLTKGKSSASNPASSTQAANSEYLIGGAVNPQYYTDQGAFNGSGIAVASQSFATDLQSGTQGSLIMYFQHWSGQIRWKQLNSGGQWLGGDASEVVAVDAKNSTPLSAVSYVSNQTSSWHIFYIDQNNTIKQRSNSNTTNVWVDGSINDMDLKVLDADMVGMQACWYGNDYGDSDYTHTPLPNGDPAGAAAHEVGMHIWYASDNTTFQQLGWRQGDDTWTQQQTFPEKSGHAGVACYSWGPGTVTYVMFVNLQNSVEFWWKDTNTNTTNSTAHPVNTWTNSSIAIKNVHPASSLGYTNFFYAQDDASLLFKGYNISWAAENTTIVQADSFTVDGEAGLPGTHLSVSALPNTSGGSDLVVFYQANGSDISEYTRDLVAGQWSSVEVPIPG